MKDDELLARVAEAVKQEEESVDPRLDAFAAGEIDEKAAREALSGAADADAVLAAYRPLDQKTRHTIVERVLADRPAARPRRVLALRLLLLGAPTAVAVAAIVFVALLPPGGLPDYSDELMAGDATVRGTATTASTRLHVDSRLEWVLRPASVSPGHIEVQTFLLKDGVATAWPVTAEISEQGSVRMVGTARSLGVPAGELDLVAIVSRRGAAPEDWRTMVEAARESGGVSGAGFRLFVRRVTVHE